MVEALGYKLRTFGIPIDGPAEVFCDNKVVVKNQSIPTSTLNKINNAILYHYVREAQADDIIRVVLIEGVLNLSDWFTNDTIFITKRQGFISKIFSNILSLNTSDGG